MTVPVEQDALAEQARTMATDLGVPGVSAGVIMDGVEHYAFHGVTSVTNPLPVDETTLFQFGPTAKTCTATAIMQLVERGDYFRRGSDGTVDAGPPRRPPGHASPGADNLTKPHSLASPVRADVEPAA